MPRKKKSSKKSSKKTAEASKKPKKMMQTHAKEEKYEPTTLDQVWGDTGNTRYGTLEEETYRGKLDEMNKSDLQAHAGKMGFIPIDDRGLLTKKLLAEFRKYVSGFKKPATSLRKPSPLSKGSRKILSEGK